MICSNCSQPISDGAKFCPECGSPVATAVAQPNPIIDREVERISREATTRASNAQARVRHSTTADLKPTNSAKPSGKKKGVLPIVSGAVIGMLIVCVAVFALIAYDANESRSRNASKGSSNSSTPLSRPTTPLGSASTVPCAVPIILTKSQYNLPPAPTGLNVAATLQAIRTPPYVDEATAKQWLSEAAKEDAKQSVQEKTEEINIFDSKNEIGAHLNELLLQMNDERRAFLSNNDVSGNEFKAAYGYASNGDTESAQKIYHAGIKFGADADANKATLKDLASEFADSWQHLDACYKKQFAGTTIWPEPKNGDLPDIFVSIAADGSLVAISAHGSKDGDLPITIFPWKW